MGKYNSFYIDGDFLPSKYRNLFAISFNESTSIIIRANHSSNQNMAVFIIPYTNCNQHAFYAMSKNIFKIEIETKNFDYNIKVCGFSPSFITGPLRKVSFGYKNEIDATSQIFYGFTTNSENSRPNIFTNIISPGFLISLTTESEIQTLSTVNTSYYVFYSVNETNVRAKLSFKREFDSKNDDKVSDNTMLPAHFDFIVYYDKHTSRYTYDDNWVRAIDINYRGSQWETMKWTWISIIAFFALVFAIVCFFLIRRIEGCSCRRNQRETNGETNDDGDDVQNSNDRSGNQLDTEICLPNVDDDIVIAYENDESSSGDGIDNVVVEDGERNEGKKILNASPYQIDDSNDENCGKKEEIPNPYGLPPVNEKYNGEDVI